MSENEKPHHRRLDSHGVAFWKGNAASNEDNADRAVVYCGSPGMPYPEFEFKLPDQRYEMERLERGLMKAFERGVYSAKAEIRSVLGVPTR